MEKKAVIYIRVSDPSQVENNSLETQELSCRRYAENHGYSVTKVFRDEGVSAKHVQTRPALRDLFTFCHNKKNNISSVIVYKIDRWTRNAEEGLMAESVLSVLGIDLLSATEGISRDPTGRFVKTLMMALAELDNNIKSERVSDNMKAMFRRGLWCWKPPVGYIRPFKTKEENKGLPPIIDKSISSYIELLFHHGSSGIYTQQQLANEANVLGFADDYRYKKKMSVNMVSDIIKNPFYYGIMYATKWDEYQLGLHEPLITEELWNQANNQLFRKKLKYKMQDNNLYPLKGLIQCDECGKYMTSSNPKGRTKNYRHYECGNPECRKCRIGIEAAHEQLLSRLNSLKPNKRVLKMFQHMVFAEWDRVINQAITHAKTIDANIARQESELDNIRKANEKGIYTDEEAKAKAEVVRGEITVLKIERSDVKIQQYDAEIVKNFTNHFLMHLDKLWIKLDLVKQQALQTAIFPKGIYCTQDKIIRTAELSPCFELIEALNASDNENVTPPHFLSN